MTKTSKSHHMQEAVGRLRQLPVEERADVLTKLPKGDQEYLLYHWPCWARPEQLPPDGDWQTWLILAGRGWGKTRTAAEWIRSEVECGNRSRIALVASDPGDARDVMVEGPSGLLVIAPKKTRPLYEPSKRRLTWPNGARATIFSSEDPEALRGPQHDGAWCDEMGAWSLYAREAWDNLGFGLRQDAKDGTPPRCIVTTTPKPMSLLTEIRDDNGTIMVVGNTYENSRNLSKKWLAKINKQYKDTRLGRQEIYAEILEDIEGALWNGAQIDKSRTSEIPELIYITVGVDPAISLSAESSETGIVVAGLSANEEFYILDDLSKKGSPQSWASAAVVAYHKWHANAIVAEINNGGDMVVSTIHQVDPNINVRKVRASRGKMMRAEPIAALYEQGRVHHTQKFDILEDQMTSWSGNRRESSPDRLDAMVWAITDCIARKSGGAYTDIDLHLDEGHRMSLWRY